MHMMHALMHMHGDGGAAQPPGDTCCVAVTVGSVAEASEVTVVANTGPSTASVGIAKWSLHVRFS
jgi:hypothetical protein